MPHLDEQTKKELLASTPPYLREARSKGLPSLGSGAIYPVSWEDVIVDPFPIPEFWKRAYGMDVGWNKTAAIWLAKDPEQDVLYAVSEYYKGESLPVVHATGIKARGEWIPGAIDPAARGRSQIDGERLFVQYEELGLNIHKANNAVEAGLYEVWSLIETGRLKFFRTLQNTAKEYRLYRRDEKGKIVKKFDHAMDAVRYGVMEFDNIAKVRPVQKSFGGGFRAADSKAGY